MIFRKSNIAGKISSSPSKSVEQRLLCAAMLSDAETIINNFGKSDDVIAARNILRYFGCIINQVDNALFILPNFKPIDILFCGESATCARLFTPVACLHKKSFVIDGEKTLLSRNITKSFAILEKFGCEINVDQNPTLPLFFLKADLQVGKYILDADSTSQIFSGLIMALPLLNHDTELIINNPKSIGYIYLTIRILEDFGISVNHTYIDNKLSIDISGNQKYKAGSFFVEGDWSGAAFFMVLAAINGNVEISNLNLKSFQPDINILQLLNKANVSYIITENKIELKKSDIEAFSFDANHCPDLIPISIILAIFADDVSYIYGANRLKTKESSRAKVMKTEMAKAGVRIKIENDLIKVYPQKSFVSCDFNSYGDHRIAMALSVFAVTAEGDFSIDNVNCVSKSFPEFFQNLKSLGGVFYE